MKKFSFAALTLACFASSAQAHFQLLYTPEVNLVKPATIPVKLIFWHPMSNGHVMDMERPQEFYYQFKDQKIDLLEHLEESSFTGANNHGKAYETEVEIKRNGDYIFVVHPAPYFEQSENAYLQQITKSYVNKGGLPTGWERALGLKTEIVPKVRPTNVLAGSTFTGQVLAEGKAVPHAEIEIEFMAAEPDVTNNHAKSTTTAEATGGALVIYADEEGYFTFGIPRAGFWGFAALGSGPDTHYEGKPLSQDAVLWIRAYDLN